MFTKLALIFDRTSVRYPKLNGCIKLESNNSFIFVLFIYILLYYYYFILLPQYSLHSSTQILIVITLVLHFLLKYLVKLCSYLVQNKLKQITLNKLVPKAQQNILPWNCHNFLRRSISFTTLTCWLE